MDFISDSFPIVSQSYNSEHLLFQILNITAYGLMILMNYTSSLIFPKSIGDISRETDSKIAPAGWAFGIWGVIYLMTGAFTIY